MSSQLVLYGIYSLIGEHELNQNYIRVSGGDMMKISADLDGDGVADVDIDIDVKAVKSFIKLKIAGVTALVASVVATCQALQLW